MYDVSRRGRHRDRDARRAARAPARRSADAVRIANEAAGVVVGKLGTAVVHARTSWPEDARRVLCAGLPWPKPKTVYSCTECGGQRAQVAGPVPALRRVEHARRDASPRPRRRASRTSPARDRRCARCGSVKAQREPAHRDRPRGVRPRAGRRPRRRRRGAARRRSRHRQVDAAAAGVRRARRRADARST